MHYCGDVAGSKYKKISLYYHSAKTCQKVKQEDRLTSVEYAIISMFECFKTT